MLEIHKMYLLLCRPPSCNVGKSSTERATIPGKNVHLQGREDYKLKAEAACLSVTDYYQNPLINK